MADRIKSLREKAMRLPLQPGVYIMKDKSDHVIYVGKAKALKNRVSQYFGSEKNHDEKVRQMVAHVHHFEFIVTDSEFEALILECSLIKQYHPKYNILLKDDKGYHYIKITKGPWSRIEAAKQKLEDGATYIGPFISSWTVKQAVDEAVKIFKLPVCHKKFPQDIRKTRPCLNYYIKQCCAPCRGTITEQEYDEIIKDAEEFLRGGSAVSLKALTEKMTEAAENMEFEKAARIRDRIAAIKKISEKQKVVRAKVAEQDVFALVQSGGSHGTAAACFEVFRFSEGRLYDQETFLMGEIGDAKRARTEFLERYYSVRDRVPPRVTLDGEVEDAELLQEWLSDKLGKKVTITIPKIGEQAQLVEMCRNNAAEKLAQSMERTGREASALDELGRLLGMDTPPMYIEAYDISHQSGEDNVAGMVVFENGRPLKSAYRKFKIKGFTGQDDYASMAEVIERRLQEYQQNRESGEDFGRLPDLILLDGGKGQISAVRPVLERAGVDIPLFGMVKDDKHKTRAIAKDGGEISILSKRKAFTLVSTIQEEVHRFAIGYHRQVRKRNTLQTELTQIPGIGDSRAKAILSYFKTMKAVKQAEIEQLELVPGMTKPAAQAVYQYFRNQEES